MSIAYSAEHTDDEQFLGHVAQNRRSYLQDTPAADTLSRDYGGLGEWLNNRGINSNLDLWLLYQANVSGGFEEDDDLNGLVYFSNFFDLERLVGWRDASFFARIDGRWGNGIPVPI